MTLLLGRLRIISLDDTLCNVCGLGHIKHHLLILLQNKGEPFVGPDFLDHLEESRGDVSLEL